MASGFGDPELRNLSDLLDRQLLPDTGGFEEVKEDEDIDDMSEVFSGRGTSLRSD